MPEYKLTQEQRREIAILANAGVPRELLARDYEVSIHTIHAIGRRRNEWIGKELITTKKKKQRFRYAQQIYPQLSPRLRNYIFDLVYKPIITGMQQHLVGESPERMFLKAVLGPESLPKIDKKALAEYRARIRRHAWILIHDNANKRVIYETLRHAVIGMGDLIMELEHASLGLREKRIRDSLRKVINQVLRTLTARERRIVKLRYGIEDGYVHILEVVGRIFHISKERVRQIESEAIKQLKDARTADKLRKLVDSPTLRRFVQRPGFSRKRGKT